MRERILSKYNFISQVLVIFSITILFISIQGKIWGDEAIEYSSLFQLGSKGIAFSTIVQLLTSSIIIASLRTFFFSDKYLKNMMVLWRTVLMLLSVVLVIVGYVFLFGWFPFNYMPAWIGFFLSFGGCFAISTILMVVKTNLEGKKYDKLLKEYKNKQNGV